MHTFLIASSPITGHVGPMLAVAERLRRDGDRVLVLTGSRFREAVEGRGLEHRALTGSADFDDRDPASYLPDRSPGKLAGAQYDIQTIFLRTIPDQHAGLRAILREQPVDALVVDAAFAGVAPLLFGENPRPLVASVGVMPLSLSSPDVAPYGMGLAPRPGMLGTLRNRVLQQVAGRVLFRQTQQVASEQLRAAAGIELDRPIMDYAREFDLHLALTVAEFEYPRRDLPASVRFVGPLPEAAAGSAAPDWWPELESAHLEGRPIVHVTQGTIDNHDFGRLVAPSLEALSDLPVLTVVTTGGRPLAALGVLPDNARAGELLPYERLLPLTSVMVTNGGYGGVQAALRHGVPLVAAGGTEDKPEVCARVAWSGAGIDLRTGTPSAAQVRRAVERVLSDPSYARRSGEIAGRIAATDALTAIGGELRAALGPVTPRRPR